MLRSEANRLVLDRVVPFQRFLAMSATDLRDILAELPSSRDRRKSPLDDVAIASLIRVMDRAGHTTVSDLGAGAARAWAARIGIS
jgi:hypothetical protein